MFTGQKCILHHLATSNEYELKIWSSDQKFMRFPSHIGNIRLSAETIANIEKSDSKFCDIGSFFHYYIQIIENLGSIPNLKKKIKNRNRLSTRTRT